MWRRAEVVSLGAAGLAVLGVAAFAVSPVGGKALSGEHSVGDFSWSSAVAATGTARSVMVQADVEGRDEVIGCNPKPRPHVQETSTTVRIRVEIVHRSLPAGVACAASALSRLPVVVQLRAPLGDRALVDGRDAARHAVLIVDQQPTIGAVPAPFKRQPTSWDEASGQVHQWWRWQAHGEAAQINLDFGPAAPLSRLGLPAAPTARDRVGGTSAMIWRQREGDTVDTTILWSLEPGRAYHLQVLDQTVQPLAEGDVIGLARSVG